MVLKTNEGISIVLILAIAVLCTFLAGYVAGRDAGDQTVRDMILSPLPPCRVLSLRPVKYPVVMVRMKEIRYAAAR